MPGGRIWMWSDWSKEQRLEEAMALAGMHYDRYDSSEDSLRFTSELGMVTYFEGWQEVTDWLHGTVFDDPELEAEIEELINFSDEKPSVLDQLISAGKGAEVHEEAVRKGQRQIDFQR